MSATPPRPRYTLRDLPLPAKLVVSAFLLSVGLGYCSALVQLHMKHSDMEGNPLPSPDDVVERFSHYTLFDGKYPKSKVEELVSGDREQGWGATNMTPAFFGKSSGYDKDIGKKGKEQVDAEREGERLALIAFINAPEDQRKGMYTTDSMPLPDSLKGKPITGKFVEDGKVQVKSIIDTRCGKCHDTDQKPNLDTFEKIEPFIIAPKPETFDGNGTAVPAPTIGASDGGMVWVRSPKTMTLDCLTQSTHAHLLSFAMLFALTGFVYAFTSHPGFVRGILGPIVLVAQVADISCWWLARLNLPYGPMFAQCIMLTGGVVGLGLMLQILLSLFNMYGVKGKVVLALLFMIAAGGFYVLYERAIRPGLDAEREKAAALKLDGKKEEPAQPGQPPQQPQPGRGNGGRVVPQ